MKKFFKKWLSDTLSGLGISMILITLVSFLPALFKNSPEHSQHYFDFIILLMRFFVLALPILSLIELSIMEFELFSRNRETRRRINIFICLCVTLCIINLFGIFPEEISKIFTVITVLIAPVSAVIAYIIQDNWNKQDISEINEKLTEINRQ